MLAVDAVDADDVDWVRFTDGIRESPCLGATRDVAPEVDAVREETGPPAAPEADIVRPDVVVAPGSFDVAEVGFLGEGLGMRVSDSPSVEHSLPARLGGRLFWRLPGLLPPRPEGDKILISHMT